MREKEWVPVSERLPEIKDGQYSERILMFGNRVGIRDRHLGVYSATGQFHSYGEAVNVTHWMPLPEPPQVTEE